MNSRVIFTIVAKNYIGLARVLGESIRKQEPTVEFVIFIADELPDQFDLPKNDGFQYLVAKNVVSLSDSVWVDMAFKYNLTEFCTALKPFCFQYLFAETSAEQVIYLDPDVYVFSPFASVWQALKMKDVVITPHIVTMEDVYTGSLLESNLLASGVFNLGFIGIRKSKIGDRVVGWWSQRLLDKCYQERSEAFYTDQKWIDFLPCLLTSNELEVLRHIGYNLAPWNFYEREVTAAENSLRVKNRITQRDEVPLVFCHFSGFNYKQIDTNYGNRNIPGLKVFADINIVFQQYAEHLRVANIGAYFPLEYSYNRYRNGGQIIHFHRRLYRRLSNMEQVGDPFSNSNKFYQLILHGKLTVDGTEPIDKLNERNLDNFAGKLRYLNLIHLFAFKLLGAKRYILFSKFMSRYHRAENQIFLLGKKYGPITFKNETF